MVEILDLLSGKKEVLKIYGSIANAFENIEIFPYLLESIYKEAMDLDEERLDMLRFALLRIQVYADIHRNEDMEKAQTMKFVAQVLEKLVFGNLMLEKEQISPE